MAVHNVTGKKIHELRIEKNLSLVNLVAAVGNNPKLTEEHLRAIEEQSVEVFDYQLYAFAQVFGVDVDAFFD